MNSLSGISSEKTVKTEELIRTTNEILGESQNEILIEVKGYFEMTMKELIEIRNIKKQYYK
jgi:hypothetical protein